MLFIPLPIALKPRRGIIMSPYPDCSVRGFLARSVIVFVGIAAFYDDGVIGVLHDVLKNKGSR